MHCSEQNGDIYMGPVVLDCIGTPSGSPVSAEKVDAEITILPGGGPVNIANAYSVASAQSPLVLAITGADPIGEVLMTLVKNRLPRASRLPTASQTRASLISVSSASNGETRTLTSRAKLDYEASLNAIGSRLSGCRRLVLASMSGDDADFIDDLLDQHKGEACMMISSSQCRTPSRTIELMRRVRFSQLNSDELGTLTDVRNDVVKGINRLRENGVESVIVTDGPRGVYAFFTGQWYYARPFDVTVRSTSRAGDHAFGLFLAAVDAGHAFGSALRAASAAGAMTVAGLPLASLEETLQFASTTPCLKVKRPVRHLGSDVAAVLSDRDIRRRIMDISTGATAALALAALPILVLA